MRTSIILPYFDSSNREMKPTTYCRRFNIAMIAVLGLCAVAVSVGVHYLSTLTINIFEL